MNDDPRRGLGPAVAAVVLTLAACAAPGAPVGPRDRFNPVDADQPGWVASAPDYAAELLATAYAASAPTTLRSSGQTRRLDHRGTSPAAIVVDYTTGDYSEVLTDDAARQLEALISETVAGGEFASVDVAPCRDDGLGDLPDEAWFDIENGEMLVRTCVHVTGVPAGTTAADGVVTELLEPVVVAAVVPGGSDVAGTGATSRILRLDVLTLHDVEESGLAWHEYVADRL